MDVLTWLGVIIGVAALVLAWVAMRRAVPAVQWLAASESDMFKLWNAGPGDAVIIEAIASSAGAEYWPAGEAPDGVVSMDEALGGWRDPSCKGTVLRQSHRYWVQVGTNCDLAITYRAAGFLGRLSRVQIRIDGGV